MCRLGWRLQRIDKTGGGCYRLTYSTPKGRRRIHTRSVALTVPAFTAAALLQVPQRPADLLAMLSLRNSFVGCKRCCWPWTGRQERLRTSCMLALQSSCHHRCTLQAQTQARCVGIVLWSMMCSTAFSHLQGRAAAHTAVALPQDACPEAAQRLHTIQYPPVAAVTLAYPMSAILPARLDAAGQLPGAHTFEQNVHNSIRGVVGVV